MDYPQAKALLIREGLSEHGMPVCVRGNSDPGHQRMMRIVKAIDALIEHEDLTAPLDRKLAYALFVIALETNVQAETWQRARRWRDGGFHQDLTTVQERIMRYFEACPSEF